jgi:hypothetical protein
MAAWMEKEQPIDARLARVHEMWWLRIWPGAPRGAALPVCDGIRDLLATVECSRRVEGNQAVST